MQIIVVSNSLSKRIEYFIEAGKHLQTEVRFMTYGELFNCLPQLRQAVIKLEPCVSDETNFLKYALLNQAYKETLQRLGEMRLSDDVCFTRGNYPRTEYPMLYYVLLIKRKLNKC